MVLGEALHPLLPLLLGGPETDNKVVNCMDKGGGVWIARIIPPERKIKVQERMIEKTGCTGVGGGGSTYPGIISITVHSSLG